MGIPAAESVTTTEPRLRIWPAVIIVALQWLALKAPESWYFGNDNLRMTVLMFAPMVGPALFLIWWLFFSRTWILDRFLLLGVFAAISMAAVAVYDQSMVMGILFFVVPVVLTAWAAWLFLTPWMRWPARSVGLAVVFIAAWGYFASMRFD